MPVATVVILEGDVDIAVFLIQIPDKNPSLVTDGDTQRVRLVRCKNHILGNPFYLHGHLDFPFIGLIQGED